MCEIQCIIFELYTNMVGGGQISHNSSIKRFFVQVSSCITTWQGCTLKFLTFIFLHWFMQCPSLHYLAVSHMLSVVVIVLPPILVPRYSEYPGATVPFQQTREPHMPHNVNFPIGFSRSSTASGPMAACGTAGKLFLYETILA